MREINQALAQAELLLLEASLSPILDKNLSIAFGDNYNITVANKLFSSWRNGNFSNLPKIELLSSNLMNGAQGAYSAINNTIYLSSSLLESNSITAIGDVILEEIGHFIDAQINDIDSQGDEGEIWRNLVLNQKMSTAQLNTLRNENDWNTIALNGETFKVENSAGIVQVTNNNRGDYAPQISGNNIVWEGYDGNDNEIFLYNGSATTQLTNNNIDEYDPQISGNNIVWEGYDGNDYEIFFYNGTTTTQLTNNDTWDWSPQISGNNVVWKGWDGSDEEIFFYNGSITTQLTNNNTIDEDPQISGNNVAWEGYDGSDYEIFLYNGTTTTQLTNNNTIDGYPQISGNNVVWSGYDGNDYEIFFYNGTTTTNLTNNDTDDGLPRISGNNVVWSAYDGSSDWEIFFYNGTTTTQLTNNNINDYAPQISGNNVVWIGHDGSDEEIFFYNGSATTQLTNNNTSEGYPQISGNNVVWQGWDGSDYEIYTYQIPTLAINDVTISEGNSGTKNAVFTVTLTGTPLQPITVNYATANGTATAGSDYLAQTGSLTFAPSETSKTISIVISGDTTVENNETFFVNLSGATNATIADGQGLGTIINDDFPTLAINDVTISEGNSGTKNAVFTVTRTGTALQTITVNYATANGTATAGSDYLAQTGSLTFAPGETSKTISIVISGDTTVENNETFFVNLSGATNATIADGQGLGTIINDEGSLITGNDSNNNLTGSFGNDTLQGLGGNDTLTGLAGNDRLEGGVGADSMVGGAGNDIYFVDNTGDGILENVNEGTDTVSSSISYLLGSNVENLTLTGTSNLTGVGNTLNNRITGNGGANILNGKDGNDTLIGGAGNDKLNGGNGNDSLNGGTANDKLLGSLGDDVLLGGDGNDTLIGGLGVDTLTGGGGGDRFGFKYADEGIDRITDFSVTEGDKIVVSASGFDGGLTANANLTAAQFVIGSSATNASQRFIYNSTNGALFFDEDGNGIIDARQIATLSTGLALTNTSIFVES